MKDPSALHVFSLTYKQNKYQKPLKIIFNWQSEFRYVVNKKTKGYRFIRIKCSNVIL